MPFSRQILMNSERDVIETILSVPKLEKSCLIEKQTLYRQPDSEVVPAGAKLPLIPGSHLHLFTRELAQRIYHDPCEFDRVLPPDIHIGTDYRCLNDRHLRKFFYNRESMLDNLKEKTLMTRENKVVCSLKEYNNYRVYLKYLQIQNLNRMMRDQYVKHSTETKIAKKAEKDKRRMDPNSSINARLKRAKDARDEMDRVRRKKGIKILKKAAEDREKIIQDKQATWERKEVEEIRREKERQNKWKNKQLRIQKEELMKKELMKFKYDEDKFIMKQLDEKRRIQEFEKQRNKSLRFERKKRFKLMKMAEMRQLWEQEALFRQHDIEVWKSYFQNRISSHNEKIKRALEEYRRVRSEANQRILEELEKRGWNALRHHNPEAYRKQLRETQELLGRFKQNRLKSSKLDFRGDATRESSRRFLDQYSSASQWLVHKVIDISKSVMLPLFNAYEERNKINNQNTEIPDLLKHLYSDFLKEKPKSPQAKSRNYLSPGDSSYIPLINIETGPRERRRLIEKTVYELSMGIASHVTHRHATSSKLASLQESIGIRINQLASSVIAEILKFSSAAVSRVSASPSSASSRVSYSASQISVDKKLSLMSKIMIDEVFGGKAINLLDGVDRESSNQMDSLAYFIAHSAIHTAAIAETEGFASNRDFYNKIVPLVEDLSYKIVGEIMKNRTEKAQKDNRGLETFEKKISKLAMTVVQSVLGEKDVSHDESKTRATDAVDASIDSMLKGLASFKTKNDIGRSSLLLLNEDDLQTISLKVARKVNLAHDQFFVTSIHILTTALAEDTCAQIKGSGKPPKLVSTEDAIKGLAEALVINLKLKPAKALTSWKRSSFKAIQEKQETYDSLRSTDSEMSSATSEQAKHVGKAEFGLQNKSPHETSSAISSAINELAELVVKSTLNIDEFPDSPISRNTSSALTSAMNELAELVVKSALEMEEFPDSPVSRNTSSALTSAMNELAELVVKSALEMNTESSSSLRQNTSSAMNSAMNELAEHVVRSALQSDKIQLDTPPRDSASAISSALNEVAEQVVKTALKIDKFPPSTSPQNTTSAVSSTISDLAEHISKSEQQKDGTSKANTVQHTNSAISSAISELAECVVESTLKSIEGRIDPEHPGLQGAPAHQQARYVSRRLTSILVSLIEELEFLLTRSGNTRRINSVQAMLSDIVSHSVAEVVTVRLADSIEENCVIPLKQHELNQLKTEIDGIVRRLFVSKKEDRWKEMARGIIAKTSLLTPTDESLISEAASLIIENFLKQLLGNQDIKLKPAPTKSQPSKHQEKTTVNQNISDAVKSITKDSAIFEVEAKTLETVKNVIHSAASRALTEAICVEVIDRLRSTSRQKLDKWHEKELKKEVSRIVLRLLQESSREKTQTDRLQVSPKKETTQWSQKALSSISSASSLLAENFMHQVAKGLETESRASLTSIESRSSVSSALSALADRMTNKALCEVTENKNLGASRSNTQSKLSSAFSSLALHFTNEVLGELVDGYKDQKTGKDSLAQKNQSSKKKLYSKSMEIIYHTSFVDWKQRILKKYGLTGLSAITQPDRVDRSLRVRVKKLDASSMLLVKLQSSIIKNVTEQHKADKDGKPFELTDSDSAQFLVENVALEIVTSLLGVEKNKSRPSSAASSKSTYSDTSKRLSPRRLAPPISAGHTPMPLTDDSDELDFTPEKSSGLDCLSSSESVELCTVDDSSELEQLHSLLDCSSNRKAITPRSDSAMSHPHRIPSPPSTRKENGNIGIKFRTRFRAKRYKLPMSSIVDTEDETNLRLSADTKSTKCDDRK